MVNLLAAPATSVNVPKFVVPLTAAAVAVPVLTILPLANGVPAEGRTRMFCQVSEQVTPVLLALAIVMVRVVLVRVTAIVEPSARPLMFRELAPAPPMRFINTVGAAPPVSNTKPVGALRMIVPVP